MEKEKESLIFFSAFSLALIGISFFAFSRALKEQVRTEQHNRCADCGRKVKKLQIHHIIPRSLGGLDTIDNAIGLCAQDHKKWDDLAFKGIFYGKI